jgi:hypothetical protein
MTCEFYDLTSSLAARIWLPVVVSQSNYYRQQADLQKTAADFVRDKCAFWEF